MAHVPGPHGITIYLLLPLARLLFLGNLLTITVEAEAPAIARAASRRCEVTVDGEVFHPLGIRIERDWLDDGVAGAGPNGGRPSPRATPPDDDVTAPTWSAGFSTLMTEAEAWRYMGSFCAGRRIRGQDQDPGQGSDQGGGEQGSRGGQGQGWGGGWEGGRARKMHTSQAVSREQQAASVSLSLSLMLSLWCSLFISLSLMLSLSL